MNRRQTAPKQWMILADPADESAWSALGSLERCGGVLLIGRLNDGQRRRLNHIARDRGLSVASEDQGEAARVHNVAELRRGLNLRIPLILLSPLFPTHTHPSWKPIPRMRAATLARLAGRRLVALGGMNRKRYAEIAPLGFIGWAGISAFRT